MPWPPFVPRSSTRARQVIVLEKGDAKYSGCIARGMDALNIVAVPGIATPELYVESNSLACEGIMDEPVNYRMAERSWALMQKLVSWGVCFPVDEKGDYEILQVHPKGRFCVTMKEPELKTILAKRMVDLGHPCHQPRHGAGADHGRRPRLRRDGHGRAHGRAVRYPGQERHPGRRRDGPLRPARTTGIFTGSMISPATPATAIAWPTTPGPS